MGAMKEVINYLKHRKKLWLLPIIVILALFVLLLIFTEGIDLVPFIYAIF